MAKFQVVFRTAGFVKAFVSTTSSSPFVVSSKKETAFFVTTLDSPIVASSKKITSHFVTASNNPIVKTSAKLTVFLETPDPNIPKELILKIGTLDFSTGMLMVYVPDATGEYDPDDPNLNPGGYNPESEDDNVYRPKRSQVKLWTVYRIWDVSGNKTLTPESQAQENDINYIYPLTFPTKEVDGEQVLIKGIYEIVMIAAPVSKDYQDYYDNDNLADIASQYPDWYSTSVGVMVDPDIVNCLNKKRYAFLQGVMCGKCSDDYLQFYANYVAMLSAMEIQNWTTAIDFYNELKTQCSVDMDSSCSSCEC